MSPEITVLANGLTVVTQTMPHVETSSLGMWIGVGARDEAPAEHGISHFLEHMSFKGTATRSARTIAEEIEAVGGELNAATGLETTAYYARVLRGDEGIALGLIADILFNSAFAGDELEREREVILQEIAATRDQPDDMAYELAHDAAYPDQPVGRPILGTEANVRGFSGDDLRAFLATHYRPASMVLAAAGAVDHGPVVRHAEALFGGLTPGRSNAGPPARYRGGLRWHAKKFEQSHLLLAFEGPSYRAEDFFAAQVFSGLFGGGMSSRLFQEVRERRGLCYSIYSSVWGLRDTGMLAVHAATGADMMNDLIDVVGAELSRVADEGPSEPELARARAQLKAGLAMSLESSGARAEQMARHMIGFGRLLSTEELVARVEAITVRDVAGFAARCAASPPSVVVVGAGRRSQSLARRAEQSIVVRAGEASTRWPS